MSGNGEENFETENKNTGAIVEEKSQSTDTTSIAKDKDKLLSRDECQPTNSVLKPPETTASVASTSVPFWKDQKFWIQIGITGVIQMYVFSLFAFTLLIQYVCSEMLLEMRNILRGVQR